MRRRRARFRRILGLRRDTLEAAAARPRPNPPVSPVFVRTQNQHRSRRPLQRGFCFGRILDSASRKASARESAPAATMSGRQERQRTDLAESWPSYHLRRMSRQYVIFRCHMSALVTTRRRKTADVQIRTRDPSRKPSPTSTESCGSFWAVIEPGDAFTSLRRRPKTRPGRSGRRLGRAVSSPWSTARSGELILIKPNQPGRARTWPTARTWLTRAPRARARRGDGRHSLTSKAQGYRAMQFTRDQQPRDRRPALDQARCFAIVGTFARSISSQMFVYVDAYVMSGLWRALPPHAGGRIEGGSELSASERPGAPGLIQGSERFDGRGRRVMSQQTMFPGIRGLGHRRGSPLGGNWIVSGDLDHGQRGSRGEWATVSASSSSASGSGSNEANSSEVSSPPLAIRVAFRALRGRGTP